MKKRIVVRVRWDKARGLWVALLGPEEVGFATQAEAVDWACKAAYEMWRTGGKLSQVVLHGRNGRIRWERTYGKDPARYPG